MLLAAVIIMLSYFKRALVSNIAIPIKAKKNLSSLELLTRLAANCCNIVKEDQLFKDVTFSDCLGTELENESVQL